MQIRNKEIMSLHAALRSVANINENAKFSYAVAKNMRKFETIVKAMGLKRVPDTPEFEEYEKFRIELCEQYAKKDENKNPVIQENNYVIEDKIGFGEDTEDLKTDHPVAIQQLKELEETNKAILEIFIEVEPHMVCMVDLPSKISANQINAIVFMISDFDN